MHRHEVEQKIWEMAKEAGLNVLIQSPLAAVQSHASLAWRELIEARNQALAVEDPSLVVALNSHIDLLSTLLATIDRKLNPDDQPQFEETPERPPLN